MSKPYFDQVDPKVNFPEMEKKLQDKWYKEGIVDKYLHKNDSSNKYFSFLDGLNLTLPLRGSGVPLILQEVVFHVSQVRVIVVPASIFLGS